MNTQKVIAAAQFATLRELKAEVKRLKAENSVLRDGLAALEARFSQALLSARDLETLAPGGKMHIWDGWNLILGSPKEACDRKDLIRQAEEFLAGHPDDFVWIVFDGHDESVSSRGRLRVSYTGGKGEHRADRFICDYMRMAVYLGRSHLIELRTNDRDFVKTMCKLAQSRRNLV